jgi:hypothetical protein
VGRHRAINFIIIQPLNCGFFVRKIYDTMSYTINKGVIMKKENSWCSEEDWGFFDGREL